MDDVNLLGFYSKSFERKAGAIWQIASNQHRDAACTFYSCNLDIG